MTDDNRVLVIMALTGVGSFFVGKAMIDGAMQQRAELKLPKVETPKPDRSRKSLKFKDALDDVVKFGGTILGMYMIVKQAPVMYDEIQKMVQQ
jgi:hypothetical protein